MTSVFSFLLLLSAFLSLLAGSAAELLARTDKPTVILVPTAFGTGAIYSDVKARLKNSGYEAIAVDLPSVGRGAAHVNRDPDIKSVEKVLRMRLREGKNVILVGSSYGATVICEAVRHFEDKSLMTYETPTGGKILGLIMFSGFIPYMTELAGTRPDIRQVSPPWFRFEGNPPTRVYWNADTAKFPPSLTLFNLLPADQAAHWASKLEPSSFKALNATAKYIPYDGKFRSMYVIGEHDNAVTPAMAKTYIEQPGAKFESTTIGSDHMAMISRPDEVVGVIRKFAGEKI